MSALTAPHFQNVDKAREYLENLRWPDGPYCPHCGNVGKTYKTKRLGVHRCGDKDCRKDFSVTTKTVMESSHIKLNVWLQAFYLMASSKKGMSAHQLHRTMGITYKSAWFLAHRIREAMRTGGLMPMGGTGKIVEADETYFGKTDEPRERKTKRYQKPTKGGRAGPAGKRPILSLVERGGAVRSFHIPVADKESVNRIVLENIERESRLHTDESRLYGDAEDHFEAHETVRHSAGEYVRKAEGYKIHTNSAEGFFSIFKRGMKGVYQHCREKHLHRYLAEYDFRYNHRTKLGYSDGERVALAIKGIEGKRLTYRQPY